VRLGNATSGHSAFSARSTGSKRELRAASWSAVPYGQCALRLPRATKPAIPMRSNGKKIPAMTIYISASKNGVVPCCCAWYVPRLDG
jgi:hypothetical protein